MSAQIRRGRQRRLRRAEIPVMTPAIVIAASRIQNTTGCQWAYFALVPYLRKMNSAKTSTPRRTPHGSFAFGYLRPRLTRLTLGTKPWPELGIPRTCNAPRSVALPRHRGDAFR